MRLALALLLGLPSAHAWAQEATCEPQAETRVENRDGSALSLRTECPSPTLRRHVAVLACADGRVCDRLEIDQDVGETATGYAALVDLDGDGLPEVEVRGMCGAGPNCEGEIHRIDPAARKLRLFFSGGYSGLQVLDGWLVESGRASCCSWEFHLWRLDAPHELPLQYENMDLMARVDAAASEDGDVDAVQCTFLHPSGDNLRAVAPPSPALERLCEHYGEPYALTPPDTTPGAP